MLKNKYMSIESKASKQLIIGISLLWLLHPIGIKTFSISYQVRLRLSV